MTATCNRENMTKWVEALESGQYSQCRGQLKKGDSYCCLGVLAVVADREFADNGDGMEGIYGPDGYLETFTPPRDLVKGFLGLSDEGVVHPNVIVKKGGEWGTDLWASEANDADKWDFQQIATALRELYLT